MVKKVLIVDDCRTTRKLISYIVKELGHEILNASNGVEALETMAANSVDLLVTDLNMPQMDGFELSSRLRKNGSYKDLPIIMITTEGSEEDRRMGKEAGITTFMTKPVSPHLLVKEIKKLI